MKKELMMDTRTFESNIKHWLRKNSGLEENRGYLGISQAGKCPRATYDLLVYGNQAMSDFYHQMCYAGYLFERDCLARLVEISFAKMVKIEVVCPMEPFIRGHVDGVTFWGDLLEVKSVTVKKFKRVFQSGNALWEHVDQVQLYMKYGEWRTTWVIYICRETFEHKVVRVQYDEGRAEQLEVKMLGILAAVEKKEPPACVCGYCGKDGRR
jgi:hypothetical protein